MNTMDYLTDEELDKLINEVESGDVIAAPADMLNEILQKITTDEKGQQEKLSSDKGDEYTAKIEKPPKEAIGINRRKGYLNYCIRVIGSVAAAIVLLMVPELVGITDVVKLQDENTTSVAKEREAMLASVPTKEELIADNLFGIEYRLPDIAESKLFNIFD